jgi:hypothetical protein
MPEDFENLSWKRNGQWSIYPVNHIGRNEGSAVPFPRGELVSEKPGSKPLNDWEEDYHELGTNDFRATRDKLIWGRLSDSEGDGITIISDGTGAMRSFVSRDGIKFLAAGFSTAGGDLFFSTHLTNERNPLKKGDSFKSKLVLRVN